MRTTTCLLLALALLSAGCLGLQVDSDDTAADPAAQDPTSDTDPAGQAADRSSTKAVTDRADGPSASDQGPTPRVTVAVVDSGANLYHEAFGSDRSWQLPAEAGATSIDLSLDASDWETAVEQDRSRLMALERETLYQLPGTVFVGAISFSVPGWCQTSAEVVCQTEQAWPWLLDDPSASPHGTATIGRLAGTNLSLAGDEARIGVVLVQVDFGTSEVIDGIEWASEQPWIDAISLSLRKSPGSGDYGAFLQAVDEAAHKKPVFKAVGNGLPEQTMGVVPKPAWAWDGTPDEIAVGGVDNEWIRTAYDLHPYIAADACGVEVPGPDSTSGTDGTSGTSMAAPYAAGAAAKLILQARDLLGDAHLGPRTDENLSAPDGAWSSQRPEDAQVVLAEGQADTVETGPLADGTFTLRELKDVLYHTARPIPTKGPHDGPPCLLSQIPAEDLPERERFAHIGYGEVDPTSLEWAQRVLVGEGELDDRPTADEEYVRAHTLRSGTMGARTATGS